MHHARRFAPCPAHVGAGFTPARAAASEALRELIDARLLTSYEVREDEHEPIRRVEIIHESLLANWPRLVRWQTQDADAIQVREQLRQAAKTWDEHDRTDDMLWTGSAFRQFSVWRESYPGGLSEVEGAFAAAMTRHATRRKRRRRLVSTAAFIVLLTVLGIVAASRQQSIAEARRADAANLHALGRLELEDYPSVALAHAIAGLELSDSMEMRRLALEALWRGPTEFRFEADVSYGLDFSPDGRWLATAEGDGGRIWPSSGGAAVPLESSDTAMEIAYSPRGDLVAHTMDRERRTLGLWSVPSGRFLRSINLGENSETFQFAFSEDGERLVTSTNTLTDPIVRSQRSWPIKGDDAELISRVGVAFELRSTDPAIDTFNSRFAWADGSNVHVAPLYTATKDPLPEWSVNHDRTIAGICLHRDGRLLATTDIGGTVRVWSLEGNTPELIRSFQGGKGSEASAIRVHPAGSMLATPGGWLWDLEAPPGANPIRILGGYGLDFHPSGDWVATNTQRAVSFWPLNHAYARVLRGHEESIYRMAFAPGGEYLVSASAGDLAVRLWPLDADSPARPRILHRANGTFAFPSTIAVSPDGSFVVVGNPLGEVMVLPVDDRPPRKLLGFTDAISWTGVGPRGRTVAASAGRYIRDDAIIRIWDLETGETTILDAGDGRAVRGFSFLPDGNIWSYSSPVARLWDLTGAQPTITEEFDLSSPEFVSDVTMDFDLKNRRVLLGEPGTDSFRIWIQNLDTHEAMELEHHRDTSGYFGWDVDHGVVITTERSGAVRVGPISGEEPHLLLGHNGYVKWAAFSPDGGRIATGGEDGTIRLWPMPDFSKPPLHTLPREELIAKLKTLTNLRVVRDPESATGWQLEVGPFPGWEIVPEW